ncbi:MAG: hypothetical protein FWD40_02805 [Treponema sp.]|nr:hypothetical protein [Treponema sp.]
MALISSKLRIVLAPVVFILLCACASTANPSDDLSPAELIQRAQEALDRNRYKTAAAFYTALYERNRSNLDLVITAEYHIAFIHYKQGRLEESRTRMNALLEYYNTPDEELLPQHFKRLAQIVINQIDEKENRRKPFFARK